MCLTNLNLTLFSSYFTEFIPYDIKPSLKLYDFMQNFTLSDYIPTTMCIREAAKRVLFFSGTSTKALIPPHHSSSLVVIGTFF